MKGATRVLTLVLALVFALNTFHSHANAWFAPDTTLNVSMDVNEGACDKVSDKDGHSESTTCPACALLNHFIVTSGPTEYIVVPITAAKRYLVSSEMGSGWMPPMNHRPPIAVRR